MEVVYLRCCGLEVYKKTIVACPITPGPDGRHKEFRTFGTMTEDGPAICFGGSLTKSHIRGEMR